MMPVEGQLLQALNAVSLHGPTAGSLSTTGTGLTGSKSTAELMREMKSLAASLGISWADMEAVVQKRQQSSALPSDGATMSKEVEMALDDKQGTVIFKEPTTMSQDPASIRSADMVKAAATFDLQPLPPSREDTAKDPRTILGRIKNKKRVMISPMSAQERQEAVSANWLIHGYMPFLPKVIRAGDRARALTMIEHGMVDLEEQGWTGQTALAFAAEEGQVSIARALIEAGALLDSTSDDGKTPLIWAAALADTSMVKLLLDHGANIEHRSRLGQTPLSWAATNGKTYVMHELLNRGADIEAKSNDGKSPLSWAAIYGMTEAVKLLVLKGANIESQSNNMQTPLLWSMEKGHERTTDLLLKLGANLDSEKRLGTTSIFLALEEGNSSVFNKLLDRFPYMIEERNQILQTPLGWAAERSDDKTVKELLERGADLEARSNNGQTPLSRAVTYGSLSTAQMLVEKGAFVESKSYNGQTPLSWAAMYGRKEMVQFLLSQRARVNTLSRNGQSPRDWAVEKGQDEVVKLLYIA